MKLLLKQEADLRCSTRAELIRKSSSDLKQMDELQIRVMYLEAQLKHSFHITEQLTNAISEQFLIIQKQDHIIQEKSDELQYIKSYTLTQLAEFKDNIISAHESFSPFKP